MDVDAVLRRARGPAADYFVVGQSSKPNTFAFKTVGRGPKLGVDIDAPYIVWHPQHVEITANEAMQAGNGTAKREARERIR
jgi:hypothetical protein